MVSGRLSARLVPVRAAQWRTWAEVADLCRGPGDPEWESTRDVLDDEIRPTQAPRQPATRMSGLHRLILNRLHDSVNVVREPELVHDTIRLEKQLAYPLDAVWRAYADTASRAEWSVPEGEEQECSSDELRSGGVASYRCGTPGELQFRGEVSYVDVVPQARIVHTDSVWAGGQLLATALVSWEFHGEEGSTTLTVTDQVTSFVGQEMIDGHRNGHTKALNQLAAFLETSSGERAGHTNWPCTTM